MQLSFTIEIKADTPQKALNAAHIIEDFLQQILKANGSDASVFVSCENE